MGFTHGKTKIGKKKYKVHVDLENRDKELLYDVFTDLNRIPLFYDEVYVTEDEEVISIQNKNNLVIIADPDIDSVTMNGYFPVFFINKKQNKEPLTVIVSGERNVINYNETFFPFNGSLDKNFFPLGPCLNDLTLNDAPGEPIEFLSGEKLMIENTTSINLVLPSIPTDLIETLRDFDKIGLLFMSITDDTHFYIRNLTPFIGMQIQSNELNQTVITVDQSFPLEFIQVINA